MQKTVSQTFSQTSQQVNSEINQKIDAINAALENKNLSAAEKADLEKQRDNWQRSNVIINMISAGLTAPTQSTAGIVAATASPALSYEIGQHFKGKKAEGTSAHILAHAVLGAAVAAAGDNNALAGAISAGGAEAAAPIISNYLYNEKDGSKLTAEQKETVTAITNLLGAATGATIGNSATNAAQGSLNAQSAIKNNAGTQGITSAGDLYNNQSVAENMADIHSFAINSFSQNKGDVAKTMQDINDYVACKGCTTAGHKYIESLATLPLEASLIVGTRGMSHIPQGAKALWYSGRIGKIARNEKAVTFTINGSANAAISAYNDPNDRTVTNATTNFLIGGSAAQVGAVARRANSTVIPLVPPATRDIAAQGFVYGTGSIGKDVINGKSPDASNAWKAGIAGAGGGTVGKGINRGVGKIHPTMSTTSKTTIEAFSGSFSSTAFGKLLENDVKRSNARRGNRK